MNYSKTDDCNLNVFWRRVKLCQVYITFEDGSCPPPFSTRYFPSNVTLESKLLDFCALSHVTDVLSESWCRQTSDFYLQQLTVTTAWGCDSLCLV